MSRHGATGRRQARRTVLLVGEGDAEENFLRHLKALYVERHAGVAVTIRNAHGKGAANVVDHARKQQRNADFDAVAALLDTDTDWNDATRKQARLGKVHPVPCSPCLEAMLLEIAGVAAHGQNSQQLKKTFARHFGCDAAQLDFSTRDEFTRARLDACHSRVAQLGVLVRLMLTGAC
jgi:hypothetical protein